MTRYKKPKRFFEDAGIVDPGSAYHVDLENVSNTKGQDIKSMVDLGRYFSIFAPRQSGKTTFFEGVCKHLANDPTYIPLLLSFQGYKSLQTQRFYNLIKKPLQRQLISRLTLVACPRLEVIKSTIEFCTISDHISFRELFEELNRIVEQKKIVIFIDEFDGIPRSELENFLTTLRELYQEYKGREDKALYSVGLVGIRNVTKLVVGGVSPFNIADQVNLPPFSLKNVHDLYGQYTEETNQPFTEGAVRKVYEETVGQPWLVNRLGTILTIDIKPETTEPISKEDVEKGVEMLLYEENSHFDNITEKAKQLKETFVDIVFNGVEYVPGDDEQSLLITHGLIKAEGKNLSVSNPIYKKRFTKTFFRGIATRVDASFRPYYLPDGSLNMERVLTDFEKYIAQIGAAAFYSTKKPMEITGKFQLTAWLYQFVPEGKGELFYESKTGLGIMDIMLIYRGKKYIIELKINRYAGTIDDALEQLTEKYLLPERVAHGYIVVFDPKTKAGELCTPRKHRAGGKDVLSFNIGIGK
ncbi:MAG: AAA-like domain-containing protein [Deltaproteobacteria bacterium]|nr:AAA-like domain-containing protein [Deltaproteobacteria bacterium]